MHRACSLALVSFVAAVLALGPTRAVERAPSLPAAVGRDSPRPARLQPAPREARGAVNVPTRFGPRDLPSLALCDVQLFPISNLQAEIDARPPGTSFCFAPGTYRLSSKIRPKNGNSFLGQLNAVLTGNDSTQWAFNTSVSNVTVAGLVVEHFKSPLQQGAFEIRGSGWVIRDNEVRNNYSTGISWYGDRHQILRNNMHHNGQQGYRCWESTNALFEGNEIAYNNTRGVDPGWEAGGGKCQYSDRLVLRNNYSHHNKGPGMWTDIDNIRSTYEGNRVESNSGFGIFHEISMDAIIRNNIISGNGDSWGWMGKSGIFVANSSNVEIYGNTLSSNGIAGVQQKRGSGRYGPRLLRNLYVHDNKVTVTGGKTGVAQDMGDFNVYARSNRFQRNTYQAPKGCTCWSWRDRVIDAREWRRYGQDTKGTFRNS